jgi:hypothetical protein
VSHKIRVAVVTAATVASVVALVAVAPADAQNAPKPTSVLPAYGALKINQGMPYNAARSAILSAGWQPSFFKKTILNEIHRDLQDWFVEAGFMEVEDCSPTGDALCVAEFHDALGKRKLYVFSTSGSPDEIKYLGHDPQIVSYCIDHKTVNCDLPDTSSAVTPTPQEMEEAKRKIIEDHGSRPGTQRSQQNWKKIKADNGAWAAIDTNSIEAWSTGGSYAIICIFR